MPSRVSTLTEAGDMNAQAGTRPWAVAVRAAAVTLIEQDASDAKRLQSLLSALKRHGGIELLEDTKGRRFRSWADFCKCPLPFGLGYDADVIDRVISEGRPPKVIATESAKAKGPLPEHGEVGNGRVDNVNSKTQGGNNAEYLLRRMLRDCPEMVERYEAGEFESVRQAAIAAGIVKVASPDEKAVAAFRRAENRLNVLRHIVAELDDMERRVLLEWVSESEA